MRKSILCIVVLVLYQNLLPAQHALSAGDKLPVITVSNVSNYPTSNIKLSDLKGKLVIIDFWATWCGSCLAAFPNMDSVQRKYKDKMIILAVSREERKKINSFAATNKIVGKVSFPLISDDTQLNGLFPHTLIPHEVWIDSTGKVYKITSSAYITSKNIESYFKGEDFNAVTKKDFEGYDTRKPLYESPNKIIEKSIINRSVLMSYLGVGGKNGMIRDSNRITLRCTDLPILELYKEALYPFPFFERRTKLEVKDSARFLMGGQQPDEWNTKNAFCYEISGSRLVPAATLRKYMLQDLNRYLGLNGRVEKRKIKTWVLNLKNRDAVMSRHPGEKGARSATNGEIIVKNQPISALVISLNQAGTQNPIVIDETGLQENIDIDIKLKEAYSLAELKLALNRFGLDISEQTREVEVFVLSESGTKNN